MSTTTAAWPDLSERKEISARKNRQRPFGRRIGTGIYRYGESTLFVPIRQMFDVQRQFAGRYEPGKAPGLRAICGGTIAGKKLLCRINAWLRHFRKVEWFAPWLLEGKRPPGHVRVATPAEIDRMFAFCHYDQHLRDGGQKDGAHAYDAGLRKWELPIENAGAWLKWLFGEEPAPEGWMVLTELAAAVRGELTRSKIAAAAGLSNATWKRWNANDTEKGAYLAAVAQAQRGGGAPKCKDWEALFGVGFDRRLAAVKHPGARGLMEANVRKAKEAMLNFAKASTLAAAEARAKAADRELTGSLEKLRADARKADARKIDEQMRKAQKSSNVAADLESYLTEFRQQLGDPGDDRRGGAWAKKGRYLETRLFLPWKWMLDHRRVAKPAWSANAISGIRDGIGEQLFNLWFFDWVLPLPQRGDRAASAYRAAVGLKPASDKSPFRNTLVASSISGDDEARGRGRAAPTTVAGPNSRDDGLNAAVDAQHLADALAKLPSDPKHDKQRKLVNGVGSLTAGKPRAWPLAKQIARAAGVTCDRNVETTLNKLAERRILRKRTGHRGFRLA